TRPTPAISMWYPLTCWIWCRNSEPDRCIAVHRGTVTIREGRNSWMRMLSKWLTVAVGSATLKQGYAADEPAFWRPDSLIPPPRPMERVHSSGHRQLVPAASSLALCGPAPFSAGRLTSGNSVELDEGTPRPIGKPNG